MKNKKYNIIMQFILLLLIVVISIPKTYIFAKEENYNAKHLITKMKNEKIYLYYDKKSSEGMFEGFYLKSGNKVKHFDWKNIDKPGFYPTIHLLSDRYIAIVCTEGEGTGVNIEHLYLLDKDTLKILNYKNPLDVIKANVTSDIQPPNVTIKIKNNTWNTTYPEIDSDFFFDTVAFNNNISYNLKEDYFTVNISAQATPALYVGDIEITYEWNENKSSFLPYYINYYFTNNEI